MSDLSPQQIVYFFQQDAATQANPSRADVYSQTWKLIEQQQARIDELAATVERLREALDELQDNSTGVAVLHMNGDIATWDSLRQGGHFESWLMAFDETPRQNLNAVKRGVAKEAILAAIEDYKREYCGQGIEALLSSFADTYPAKRYPDKE